MLAMRSRLELVEALAAVAVCLLTPLQAGAQEGGRPLVFITIDTLRADRVGRAHSITPAIDALARDGVSFERAMVQVPITLPSHVSIMSASHPHYHGIRDFGGIRLKDDSRTLAEVFKQSGYRTAAFVSSFALDSTWGLDQGFDLYHDDFDLSGYRGIGFNAVERQGDETMDLALQWLSQAGQGPFFLWVHLFDPHDPYHPPSPFKERFAAKPYDGEVAFADHQVGRLIGALKERGLYHGSLLALMGDHGESLGEHGEETHGFFVYNSTLHVPLVLKLPDGEFGGRKISQVVQSIDVAPTLLQILHLPRPREWQGRGMLGLIRNGRYPGQEGSYGESLYGRYHFGWSSLTSFQDGKYKFIRAPRKELYNLQEDPLETTNLYEGRTALAEQYNNYLDQLIGKYRSRKSEAGQKHDEMDEETRRRLQSLGYVAVAAESHFDEGDLDRADPKDKVGLFAKIRQATLATERGRLDDSSRLLSEVIADDPGIYSARYLLGFNQYQGGRFMAAVNEFKQALKIFPDSTDAVHSLASSYLKLGMEDSALTGFERLVQLEPQRSRGYLGQGRILLKHGNYAQAETLFRQAVERGDRHYGRLGLGRALVALEKIDEALKEFQAVAEEFPNSAEAHSLLAYTYTKKGDPDLAKRHQEISQRLAKPAQPDN